VSSMERAEKEGSGSDEYPTPETVSSREFPDEFTEVDNWCVWQKIDGAKRPVRDDDPTTPMRWSDESNRISHVDAMGLVATKDVEPGFIIHDVPPDEPRPAFFDFDDVRDPDSGAVHPTVLDIIDTDDLYAMVSTSGTGVHAYGYVSEVPEDYVAECEFDLPDDEKFPDATCEVYARMRFIAITGKKLVGSADELPNVTSEVDSLIREHGREKNDAEEHEPELDREEIEEIEKTNDMGVIFDAIKRTEFSDFRLDSSVTNRRADGSMDLDPSWTDSDSGTRLGYDEDGFVYRKGNYHLDALQVVALEEGFITDESEYPEGEAFHTALDELRERGAPIPRYIRDEIPDEVLDDVADDPMLIRDEELWDLVRDRYEVGADGASVRQAVVELLEHSGWFQTRREGKVLYGYDPDAGIFRQDGEGIADRLLEEKLGRHVSIREKREIRKKLKDRTLGVDFDPPDEMVCLGNGVLNLDTGAVEPHSPEYGFQSALCVEYDPDAECPRWQEFVERTFESEAHIKRVQEYAGYTLEQGQMPVARALFIAGPRDTGKSVFLDTLKRLYRDDSMSSVSPQGLTDQRFRKPYLEGSLLNTRNDIDDSMIENAGMFKEITAGEEIFAERKGKDGFFFRPTAKHIYAANKLPVSQVDDDAFFKRVMLVTASNQVPDDEKIRNMPSKFEDEWGELPGILNWAIEGLERLQSNNHEFTGYPPSADERIALTRREWRAYAKSGLRWAEECCLNKTDSFIPWSVAYESYQQYCDEKGLPVQSESNFKKMVLWPDERTKTKQRSDLVDTDNPVWGVRDLHLMDEWEPTEADE